MEAGCLKACDYQNPWKNTTVKFSYNPALNNPCAAGYFLSMRSEKVE